MRTPPDSANPPSPGSRARLADPVVSVAVVIGSGGRAGRERVDGLGGHGLAPDAPVPALDLFDDDPGHRAHVLTLDLDHRVGELLDDLLLLVVIEDAFDELDVDERHVWIPPTRDSWSFDRLNSSARLEDVSSEASRTSRQPVPATEPAP